MRIERSKERNGKESRRSAFFEIINAKTKEIKPKDSRKEMKEEFVWNSSNK